MNNISRILYLSTFFIYSLVFKGNTLAHEQNRVLIDSLETQIKTDIGDSLRMKHFNELAWQYRKSDPEKAILNAIEAKAIAVKEGFKVGESTSLNRIGEVKRLGGEYADALTYFEEALSIEEAIDRKSGIGRATSQLCIVHRAIGNYEKAQEYGLRAKEIYLELGNQRSLARTYDRLANINIATGDFDAALSHLNQALEIKKVFNDSSQLATSYVNLGNLNNAISNEEEALDFYTMALKLWKGLGVYHEVAKVYTNFGVVFKGMKDYPKAIDYNLKSLHIKDSLGLEQAKHFNYNNLGNIYQEIGAYAKAREYFEMSLALKEKSGSGADLMVAHINLGSLFLQTSEADLALQSFTKALSYSDQEQFSVNQMELYQNLSEAYLLKEMPEMAVVYENKYLQVRNRIDNASNETLKMQKRLLQAQTHAELLSKEAELNLALSERKSTLIYALLFFLASSIILAFYINRSYKLRNRVLLAERNYAERSKQVETLLKSQELKEINAMLDGQEGERKRIAQDLHDRLGSMLSMVKVLFKSVEENLEKLRDDNKGQYDRANNLLDEACEEVRKIAHDMSSGVLNRFGLVAAVKNLATKVISTGQLEMEVLVFGLEEERLDYEVEINLYRIIQEIVSNTLKYAGAEHLTVQLIKKEKRLSLTAEDNGVGFDLVSLDTTSGMGFRNIEARVEKLQGELTLDSSPGHGLTVVIDLPVNS